MGKKTKKKDLSPKQTENESETNAPTEEGESLPDAFIKSETDPFVLPENDPRNEEIYSGEDPDEVPVVKIRRVKGPRLFSSYFIVPSIVLGLIHYLLDYVWYSVIFGMHVMPSIYFRPLNSPILPSKTKSN